MFVVDHDVYAVFLFPPALEALGDAIKPYISQGHAGPQILCHEVDTGGAFVELELRGKNPQGKEIEIDRAQLIRPRGGGAAGRQGGGGRQRPQQ